MERKEASEYCGQLSHDGSVLRGALPLTSSGAVSECVIVHQAGELEH